MKRNDIKKYSFFIFNEELNLIKDCLSICFRIVYLAILFLIASMLQ
jgi:predicted membrane chloride channel (bestrophin family)